ncbi:cyclase family protein [Dyadobacter psychrotolerans]|uniref:Cyclase family protein n=1 Tax=Dyadobacter psychrotolerans TaxID=2541721 RepID=A0A4V2Z2W0_9BACT|nr:cyclase family protein [Dyadobacter psychrotolerans]TDE10258.1 cyclase family protein [Dyadobacter psychrotolerans]
MQYRVVFDFEVTFTNGGGIQGQDFRLDIEGENISDSALTSYIIEDLRLLMVDQVRILNKFYIQEKHKRQITDPLQTGQLIDLSHTIFNGLITYKGLPAPVICDFLSRQDSEGKYEEGTTFQIGKIEMVSNTGTYIDCPFHRFEHGTDLSQTALESFANLAAITIEAKDILEIGPEYFINQDLTGKAVLVNTGWSAHWNTDHYFENHPFLTSEAAQYLAERQVKLVGIDSHNIDDTRANKRPVHTILLGSGILIVEHLCNLDKLPDSNYLFSAVPPKFKGVGTFPVRAFATL